MGATIAAIIAGVVKLLGVVAEWLSRAQLLNAGKAEEAAARDAQALDTLKKQSDIVMRERTNEEVARDLDAGKF
jgi:hypothetical protein